MWTKGKGYAHCSTMAANRMMNEDTVGNMKFRYIQRLFKHKRFKGYIYILKDTKSQKEIAGHEYSSHLISVMIINILYSRKEFLVKI